MRQSVFLLVLALVTVQSQGFVEDTIGTIAKLTACQTGAANLYSKNEKIFNGDFNAIKNMCLDFGKGMREDLTQVLDACQSDVAVPALNPLLFFLSETLCTQDPNKGYCMISVINVIPFAEIFAQIAIGRGNEVLANLEKSDLVAALGPDACQSLECSMNVVKAGTKAIRDITRQFGFVLPNPSSVPGVSLIQNIMNSVTRACLVDDKTKCLAAVPNLVDLATGNVNFGAACIGNGLSACARKLLGSFGPFLPNPVDATTACGSSGSLAPTRVGGATFLGGATFSFENLLFTAFQRDPPSFTERLVQDLAFNLPGVLGSDLSVDVLQDPASLGIIAGVAVAANDLGVDVVNPALRLLANRLDNGLAVSFPSLDSTLPDTDFVDSSELTAGGALTDGRARILQFEVAEPPKPQPDPSVDNTSAASSFRLSHMMALLVPVFALVAVWL